MPSLEDTPAEGSGTQAAEPEPFPPVTREHITHCSYDVWFPKYKSSCLKSRLIPLPPEAVGYLREDGIILADDDGRSGTREDDDDDWEPAFSARPPAGAEEVGENDDSDSDSEPVTPRLPPNQRFPATHQLIKDKIRELGGAVIPKLNWSAPKDAAWISPHQNTLKCTTPNDIYLLLKSSSFVSHDLELAFDDCVPRTQTSTSASASGPTSRSFASESSLPFQPVLVLRPFFSMHPALEFRCFVKHRTLVAITPRDLNYFPFLSGIRSAIVSRSAELFDSKLRFSFPESCFAFDVYIPYSSGAGDSDDEDSKSADRLDRARLVDINPWAPRTDTLLFSWQELLDLRVPRPMLGGPPDESGMCAGERPPEETDGESQTDNKDENYAPELRLVEKDDPAAFNFSSARYSAHKLPKDVVDASLGGEGGLREFAEQWNSLAARNGH